MILDIFLVIIVIICLYLSFKRGFTLEFFELFKYILILYLIDFIYPIIGKYLHLEMTNTRNMLITYFITFFLLYLIFTIILFFTHKFLQSIKLKSGDHILALILGVFKSTFIIFIIYVVVIIGSNYSKKIDKQKRDSKAVKIITQYPDFYIGLFPDFIVENIIEYKTEQYIDRIEKNLLKSYREKNGKIKDENSEK